MYLVFLKHRVGLFETTNQAQLAGNYSITAEFCIGMFMLTMRWTKHVQYLKNINTVAHEYMQVSQMKGMTFSVTT